MKNYIYPLIAAFFLLSICLQGQESAEPDASAQPAETPAPEEMEIPTEVSEPPYSVGDLVTVSGFYFERGEEVPKINLRIVENNFRLYWIDKNGLIAEPEFSEATVRLIGSARGPLFHSLQLLPEGSGLGAPSPVLPPHIFNGILALIPSEEGVEPTIYSFRYTNELDVQKDPEGAL